MNQEHYEQKSISYGIGHTRLRRILALAGDVSGKKVLDIGCARGYLGAELKKKGAYIVGTDISNAVIEIAKEKLDEAYAVPMGEILPANAQKKFDIVILSEVIEHIFDPVPLLRKIHDVLKPDGYLILTTPNFLTWTNRLRFLFGRFAYQEQGMFDFGHIRWFTYSYLKRVLNEAGFEIMEERHIIFPGKLTKVLKKWPGLFAWQFIVKAQKK